MTQAQFDAAVNEGRWADLIKECFVRDSAGNVIMRSGLVTFATLFGIAARGVQFDSGTASLLKILASGTDADIDIELVGKGAGGAVISKLAKPLQNLRAYQTVLTSQGWVGKIRADIALGATHMCVLPNGLIARVTGSTTVSFINPLKGFTTGSSVAVGAGAGFMAYCPTQNKLYVACFTSGTIAVINPDTQTLITTTAADVGVNGIAYCPSNDRIYVVNATAGNVVAINPSTDAIVATITGITGGIGIAYCPSNDRIYVAGSSCHVINPSTNALVTSITVGTGARGVCYCPSNDRIYCTNTTSGNVSVIDPATNTVVATITVGSSPHYPSYSPVHGLIYVPNSGGGTVSIIKPSSGTVIATVATGTAPQSSAWSPHDQAVYIANATSLTISTLS